MCDIFTHLHATQPVSVLIPPRETTSVVTQHNLRDGDRCTLQKTARWFGHAMPTALNNRAKTIRKPAHTTLLAENTRVYVCVGSHQTDIYISTHLHPAQPVSVPMPPRNTSSAVVTNYETEIQSSHLIYRASKKNATKHTLHTPRAISEGTFLNNTGRAFDSTEGARLSSSLRFADGQKMVHKRKCIELELFLPGSPRRSYKKRRKKKTTRGATRLWKCIDDIFPKTPFSQCLPSIWEKSALKGILGGCAISRITRN